MPEVVAKGPSNEELHDQPREEALEDAALAHAREILPELLRALPEPILQGPLEVARCRVPVRHQAAPRRHAFGQVGLGEHPAVQALGDGLLDQVGREVGGDTVAQGAEGRGVGDGAEPADLAPVDVAVVEDHGVAEVARAGSPAGRHGDVAPARGGCRRGR